VRARLDLQVNDLGQTQLKNIVEPVRVYSLQVGLPAQAKAAAPVEPATEEKPEPRLALPDKPSIAVLPFQNMSGDPEQEYFVSQAETSIVTPPKSAVRCCSDRIEVSKTVVLNVAFNRHRNSMSALRPFIPQWQTQSCGAGKDAKGHQQTHALQHDLRDPKLKDRLAAVSSKSDLRCFD
jgi:hypothetical protein